MPHVRIPPVSFSLLLLAISSPALGQPDSAMQGTQAFERFALVELYTSQGCSSCPPADELLRTIDDVAQKQGLPIYVLSYHVDYWNSLGWKDPYSQAVFSQRQRSAAQRSGNGRVYTPQMVVNGTESFVGSNSRLATDAIKGALAQQAETTIKLSTIQKGDQLTVRYEVDTPHEGDQIVVVLTSDVQSNKVPRGENAGRTLTHRHVVMAYKSAELDATGVGTLTLPVPALPQPEKAIRVTAYVETPSNGAIRAVAAATP